MSLYTLSLILAAALLHAWWNTEAKKAGGGVLFVWLYEAVSSVLALPVCALVWLRLQPVWTWQELAAIVASAVIHIAYGIVLQRGYRAGDFSVVYPVARGSGPLFSVAGAVLLLHEVPGLLGWVGIGMIVPGIVLISGTTRALRRQSHASRGVIWGLLTGLCIASYTVVDGWAVKYLALTPVLYYGLSLMVRTLLLAPYAWRDRAALALEWRRTRRHALLVGLLSPLAYLLVLQAMTMAPISFVAPAREVSMLVGLLIGARLLGEGMGVTRLLGALLLVGGIAVLAQA